MAQFAKRPKRCEAIALRLAALNKQIDGGGGQAVAARRRKAELVDVPHKTDPASIGEAWRGKNWNGVKGKQKMRKSAPDHGPKGW